MARIKSNPTVSVIIPTYNRAHLVCKAIQSVLNQTYQDFELIVVDDGSTDNTEKVVKGFNDERLRYIRLEKNSGASAVPRNTGLEIARGEYIACDDDDTEWLPQKLEKQMKAFEGAAPKVGVIYTGMWMIEGNEKIYWPFPNVMQKEGNIYKELLKRYFMGMPIILVKKECFNRVGMFDEKLPFRADWDMWLRVSRHYDFKLIDEPLVIAYCPPISLHTDRSTVTRGQILFLEKHLQEFKENDRKSLAEHYFNVGLVLCIDEDLTQFAEGRRCLKKAAKICPLNFKYILFSLISLSGPALFHNRPLRKLYRQFKKILGRAK